jgi:cytochrome P450
MTSMIGTTGDDPAEVNNGLADDSVTISDGDPRQAIYGVDDAAVILNPDTYTRAVPYAALARLRRRGVAWLYGVGAWGVFRHADVRTVLQTPHVFSSHLGGTQIQDPATREDLAYIRQMMLNCDPPEHTRLRGLLTKAFTPRAVARLGDQITRWATELVTAVADRGRCDFVADVAADLPLLTLAEIFGVPTADRVLLFDWSNRVIGYQDPEYAASTSSSTGMTDMAQAALRLRPLPDTLGKLPDPRSRGGTPDLYAYAHALAEYKRRHPGEDVMSTLVRSDITVEEFENLFWLFSVAGNETVRNGIPGGLISLLSHPEQYRRLRADRSLLPGAVEEMLRWWSPVMHFRRTATVDTDLSGVHIKAGDRVVVWFSAANRDEKVFPHPDVFDIGRSGREHLSFGHGPHFCLGAHLARMQMQAIFTAVLDHLDDLALDGLPVRLRSNFQNGIKHLPISWTPGGSGN